jgi:hypothetical protein
MFVLGIIVMLIILIPIKERQTDNTKKQNQDYSVLNKSEINGQFITVYCEIKTNNVYVQFSNVNNTLENNFHYMKNTKDKIKKCNEY